MADRVTVVHDGDRSAATVEGELVELATATVRVRLGDQTELPHGRQRYVVVVHRDPPVFILADRIDGETEPQMFRFARVAKGA